MAKILAHSRLGRSVALLAIAAFASVPLGLATPRATSAYTWSAWTTKYYTATTRECSASREAATHFIGPIQYYSSSCVTRVRSRFASVDTWAGWTDRIIQIEAVAPYWSGAWGENLTVTMHRNGSIVRYSPETLICKRWAVYFTISNDTCTVLGDGTFTATARVAYDVSFSILWAGAMATRGAQQGWSANGTLGALVQWP